MTIPMLDLTRLHAPLAAEPEAAFRSALVVSMSRGRVVSLSDPVCDSM